MNSYKLKIITPEKTFFDGETTQIVVRTSEGDTGILAGHIDYVSNILTGPLKVKQIETDEYRIAAVADGIMVVANGEVTILPQSAEWADEIDIDRAEAAKKRAEEKIAEAKESGAAFDFAEAKLKRALTRISVYNGQK
ncbi:MAG: ATP synthase F1 subunit epsilon [Ruminococcus sp.]|nr:ATP synthase F1 subunit epsilon [Ruminococcus sp.]